LREVQYEEGLSFAKANDIEYFMEVSAKNNMNLDEGV
jgi:hypothetical protein